MTLILTVDFNLYWFSRHGSNQLNTFKLSQSCAEEYTTMPTYFSVLQSIQLALLLI